MLRKIKILIICLFSVLLFNCRTIQYVPINNETVIEYRDTTIYKDSLIYIPKETVKDVTSQLDTLTMETSMAKAKAWVDTNNNVLRGTLDNKKGLQYKYVYKDRIVTKDSIVYNEVPVPVIQEKIIRKNPWYFPIVLLFAGLGVATIIKILIRLYAGKKA